MKLEPRQKGTSTQNREIIIEKEKILGEIQTVSQAAEKEYNINFLKFILVFLSAISYSVWLVE